MMTEEHDKELIGSDKPDEPDTLEPDPISQWGATEQLLDLAFNCWASIEFLKPCFHFMTRTFAHFRKGEEYDTDRIFDQLFRLNHGKHEELLDELTGFREVCFSELKTKLLAQRRDSE